MRTLKRVVRANKWHRVAVTLEPTDVGTGFVRIWELEIRINSDPANPGTSAYLTPKNADDLAWLLRDFAKRARAFGRQKETDA